MSRVAVVGSSPQLLIDAIRRARAGAAVTVFEGREHLGGAWATTDFAGYRRVEVACHLLERDPVGYAALADLGVELAPMDPQPRTVLRPGFSRLYTAPTTAAAQLAFYPVARTLRRRELTRQGWRRRRRLATRELVEAVTDRSPVLGLVGGAGAMVDTLVSVAEREGVVVRTATRVGRLDLGDGRPSLDVAGDAEEFDLVVIPAAFAPDRLTVDGVVAGGTVWRRSFAHRLLAMPSGSVAPHSYVRFPRDPVLQRCSDVTHAAVPTGPAADADLLLVSERCDDRGRPLHDLATLLARLRTHGLIGAADPVDERTMRYEGRDAAPALRAAVGRRDDVVVLDSFGDLTRAIAAMSATPAADPVGVR